MSPEIRVQPLAGLGDVTQSIRVLVKSSTNLATNIGDVAAKQLSMTIDLAERLRDESISKDTLERARKDPLAARLRHDAHRVVDLVADVSSVAYILTLRFAESLADSIAVPLTDAKG